MHADSYRQLKLLGAIASGAALTQRDMAKRHGLALGLTNVLIREFIHKGLVTTSSAEGKRIRYSITANGLAHTSQLAREYFEDTLDRYRELRAVVRRTIAALGGPDRTAVLYGTDEVSELVYLALQQAGLSVVAVVSDHPDGSTLLHHTVRGVDDLNDCAFDWVVITSIATSEHARATLERAGVPGDKIVTIPHHEAIWLADPVTSSAACEPLAPAPL